LGPVYSRTGGVDGYASLEVSPALAHDTETTIAEAKRLFNTLGRPNVMIKVPATPAGIPAIRRLISEGVNINVTLIFSLDVYQGVREAYISGLEDLLRRGGDIGRVASVASFFVSRVDTAVDAILEELKHEGNGGLDDLFGKAAIANSKLAFREFRETFAGERFNALKSQGAMVQRLLWGSTSTKNPGYSDLLYVENLIGRDTINTMPPATLTVYLEHGAADLTLDKDVEGAEKTVQALEAAGVSMEQVTSKLLADGVKSFADSFDKLLANIEEKKTRLLAQKRVHPGVNLGGHLPDVEATLADLQRRDVVARIWRKDHTVWKQDPTGITDRLGWLNVTEQMVEQVAALNTFADEVRESGFRHGVLLGMGGSSLGPEVFRQTFGKRDGYPELIVLDSTAPASVQAVADAIDPACALFLVSSKSGSTIESLSFHKHFRGLVESAVGKEKAGQSFVAITDRGTMLERLAQEHGFRRAFANPADIGGRYSVLSYFGLLPAVLSGVDGSTLLDRADSMREGCASCVPAHQNPGAWLGAIMGTLASKGRDKLTIVTSPSIASFGLWAEQLIAESTGKEGRGIVPVAAEPLLDPVHYGDDRFFVYMRMEEDDNSTVDEAVKGIEASGQPVMRLELRDRYDLGAEFFRWEFAAAVAGAVLDINPFDQPNVQQAKDLTNSLLKEYQSLGSLSKVEADGSLGGLLGQAKKGDYLAIMPYIRQAPETDEALAGLRRKVTERYNIATTVGYGPRFLHSTGQLHKGGPDKGLFFQIVGDHQQDISIPGEPYSFAVLVDAQASGDLRALQAQGRRVARAHLGSGGGAAIEKLAGELG
ncbi:MAG: bifunctional transaldolase/phosoglucose isomerase, partial [Dehalococcoidia bacterium]